MVAALYVMDNGPYQHLLAECWPAGRDARTYPGPWPVVAHPPCQRWSRWLWHCANAFHGTGVLGDDGGCFKSALAAVRRFGGVLEHPALTYAFAHHGLNEPAPGPYWTSAGFCGGWVAQVDQGWFGHPAAKPTWLYASAGCELPKLPDKPFRSPRDFSSLSTRQRIATPLPFAGMLIRMAESCL